MRAIVFDFGLDVNAYAALGPRPPWYKPPNCPTYGCVGQLRGHGVRARTAWLSAGGALEIFVRRLFCPCCRHSFTVLPGFLHPRRRYVLEAIEETVTARFIEPRASYAEMEAPPGGPAPSTQREWCASISLNAEDWLSRLTHWLARVNPTVVLSIQARYCVVAGLLALMVHGAEWSGCMVTATPLRGGEVLERLWLWGNTIVCRDLLPPTRCRAGP